ncbi:unnamed protein product [Linum trigynum]|uniref:Uncharacterized protein n=1 Tax=Linum trigynum TaxID=586398 RepID=A0AAV2FY77_9ROSI
MDSWDPFRDFPLNLPSSSLVPGGEYVGMLQISGKRHAEREARSWHHGGGSWVRGDGQGAASLYGRGANRQRRKEEEIWEDVDRRRLLLGCFAPSLDSAEGKGELGFRVTKNVVVLSLASSRIVWSDPDFDRL